MNVTEGFIRYSTSTRYEDLPENVVTVAKRVVMNTVAAIIAGSTAEGIKELASLMMEWGGKKEATLMLHGCQLPAHEAVMVNASMARALDFDEYNLNTGVHTGATVVPIALAASELCSGTNGKDFIAAVVVGAEIMSRMRLVPDLCIGVSGWTGEIFGGFGGAITAGRILGLTEDQMWNALGLAFSQASGTSQTIYDGVLATRFQQGFSARAGFVSARLAQKGLTGVRNFLDGKAGFYPVYYRGLKYNIGRLLDNIGEKYEFLNIATKPYPSCGFNMGPIENILDIMREQHLKATDISKIRLHVNQQMYNTVCAPPETRYRPETIADAMFSLPYVLGTATLKGSVELDDFMGDVMKDPKRLEMADKVEINVDSDIDKESKKLGLALSLHVMDVETKSGTVFSKKLYYAKGFPQKPMTLEDCTQKAKRCAPFAVKAVSEQKIKAIRELVENIEDVQDMAPLAMMLS